MELWIGTGLGHFTFYNPWLRSGPAAAGCSELDMTLHSSHVMRQVSTDWVTIALILSHMVTVYFELIIH